MLRREFNTNIDYVIKNLEYQLTGNTLRITEKLMNGYGNCCINMKNVSHRKYNNMKNNYQYTLKHHWGNIYEIPNTQDAIIKAREFGCTVSRKHDVYSFIILTDEQLKIFNELTKRNQDV